MTASFTPAKNSSAPNSPAPAPPGKIKLNGRGLLELVTGCAFLALFTAAIWSWQIGGGRVVALDAAAPESQGWIIWRTLQDPVVMFSSIVAEFVLLLALALALVPPAWWLRADHILGTVPASSTTPLRWLEHKIQSSRSQSPEQGQPVVGPTGEPIYYEQPGIPGMVVNPFSLPPGQVAPGQPIPGQMMPGPSIAPTLPQGASVPGHLPTPVAVTGEPLPNQPVAGQLQPGQPAAGQAQPGQLNSNQPGQAQPNAATPATVTEVPPGQAVAPPAAPLADVLNFEQTQEDDPIADLANIADILTSAFDEDAGIDPDIEALARTLPEVDILLVRTTGNQVLARFRQ